MRRILHRLDCIGLNLLYALEVARHRQAVQRHYFREALLCLTLGAAHVLIGGPR